MKNISDKEIQNYKEKGYIVIKKAIKNKLIDEYLDEIDNILDKRKFNHWHTQHTHVYKKLKRNSEGLLEDSLQNPHAYCWSKKLRKTITAIICNQNLEKYIQKLYSSNNSYGIWQSMYFDKTTGTLGHQDSYYLDTEERGGVVGCWFALEDIKEGAGPFYVIPKSHKDGLLYEESNDKGRYQSHDSFVDVMKSYEKNNEEGITPLYVEKGDIVLWHSLLFHGALNSTDKNLSRKSLTAHYFPIGEDIRFFEGLPKLNKAFDNFIPIMGFPKSLKNITKSKVKTLLAISKNSFYGLKEDMDMRRNSYKKK